MRRRSCAPALRWLALGALFLCYLYLAWNVPYTHDDWDWGLDIGLQRWLTGALNNRYAGTFFVIVMTRSPLLKTLILAVCMFAIPLLLALLATHGDARQLPPLILLANAALLPMPMLTWQQTYGWVSAFANFVVSAVGLLLLLWLLRSALTSPRPGPAQPAALFVLALLLQLFSENLTLSMVLGAAALMVWSLLTHRSGRVCAALLCGCLLGAFLMFHNPLYGDLLTQGSAVDHVRETVFSPGTPLPQIAATVLHRLLFTVLPGLYEWHPAVCSLLCMACLRRLRQRGLRLSLIPLGLWMALYALQCWVATEQLRLWGDAWVCPWPIFRGLSPLLLTLLLLLCLITDRAAGGRRWPRLILLLCSGSLLLPFGVIAEFGPRCYFLSIVLLLLLALDLLTPAVWPRWFNVFPLLLLTAALVHLLHVYTVIGQTSARRAQLVEQAIVSGASSVALPTEPWSCFYFWSRNPSPVRMGYFKDFYHIPAELELVFLDPGQPEPPGNGQP